MHIEKLHNQIFHITLSGYELATLISSARWAAEGAKGELTAEAVSQLKQVVSNYERSASKMNENLAQEK
ncbi:MAG: hypothetical protein V4549_19250 [Bacteroidota bacterium]